MNDNWRTIYLSAKVFGHLSQGLYRTPAGAIKELISNSFDADSTLVRIHTGFPRFETFSCEDNGTGMSVAEFERLMNRGIGSSYKRASAACLTSRFHRPVIGRLGLGILSLAQICTRFDIVSHHEETETAFRATIEFPPYTRQEMDRIAKNLSSPDNDERVCGGKYRLTPEKYDPSKRGLRVFTKYLREPFRKRMRALKQFRNRADSLAPVPYRTFNAFLDALYRTDPAPTPSLNLLSDYDQLLFGLALAPPLGIADARSVAIQLPTVKDRQARLRKYKFEVQVDALTLINPVCLPFDRDGNSANRCALGDSDLKTFTLTDGLLRESCRVMRHQVTLCDSDLNFNLYELAYNNSNVAGSPLVFTGYLFQQTGRLYPRDIQGILIRLNDVAIGKYDNSMLTYPYAEGPRYSMVSSELFVERGFEDALNIDRDSFNELHPHYIRVQSFVHGLLHQIVFPETWTEEKVRNRARRTAAVQKQEISFIERYRKATGERVHSIQRCQEGAAPRAETAPRSSPVAFEARRGEIHVDRGHPLLAKLFRRRKYSSVIERVVVAFERANLERSPQRRRALFYALLSEIFTDL